MLALHVFGVTQTVVMLPSMDSKTSSISLMISLLPQKVIGYLTIMRKSSAR